MERLACQKVLLWMRITATDASAQKMEQDMPALRDFAVQWTFKAINRKILKVSHKFSNPICEKVKKNPEA